MGHCERRDGGHEWILSAADIERIGGRQMLEAMHRARGKGESVPDTGDEGAPER